MASGLEVGAGRGQARLLQPRPRGDTVGACRHHNGVGGPGRAQRDHALVGKGNRHASFAEGEARACCRLPVPCLAACRGGGREYASTRAIRSKVLGTHGLRGHGFESRVAGRPCRVVGGCQVDTAPGCPRCLRPGPACPPCRPWFYLNGIRSRFRPSLSAVQFLPMRMGGRLVSPGFRLRPSMSEQGYPRYLRQLQASPEFGHRPSLSMV